jgi:DNA (cytosine-5)-methyltransferase 1
MRHGSLFSGIGGFDLAAQWMGWENVFQVEKDSFCQKVLAKNFQNVTRYGDIKEFNGTKYRGAIDVLSGGFPCQPFSHAGRRKGKEDDRYLWPQMHRVIKEINPSWVVAENVYGILTIDKGMVFKSVCTDLENTGYEVQSFIIPACGVGARHRRKRIWIIGKSQFSHPNCLRSYREKFDQQRGIELQYKQVGQPRSLCEDVANPNNIISGYGLNGENDVIRTTETRNETERRTIPNENNWHAEPSVGRMANGIPNRVDRIRGLGNAIVPQVAYEIFKAIEQTHLAI